MYKWKVLLIVLSDRISNNQFIDTAGEAIKNNLISNNFEVINKLIIPDDYDLLKGLLIKWSNKDLKSANLILTIGGTGLSKRDITPQVTREVIDLEIPGLTEFMRMKGYDINPFSLLSRSIAGILNSTVIINLPGSLNGASESLGFIIDLLDHLLMQVNGKNDDVHIEPLL